jgi:hypothetical protein
MCKWPHAYFELGRVLDNLLNQRSFKVGLKLSIQFLQDAKP